MPQALAPVLCREGLSSRPPTDRHSAGSRPGTDGGAKTENLHEKKGLVKSMPENQAPTRQAKLK